MRKNRKRIKKGNEPSRGVSVFQRLSLMYYVKPAPVPPLGNTTLCDSPSLMSSFKSSLGRNRQEAANTGTSLVVQWLRLCTRRAGDPGLIPDQETRPHILQIRVGMPRRRSHVPQLRPSTAKWMNNLKSNKYRDVWRVLRYHGLWPFLTMYPYYKFLDHTSCTHLYFIL